VCGAEPWRSAAQQATAMITHRTRAKARTSENHCNGSSPARRGKAHHRLCPANVHYGRLAVPDIAELLRPVALPVAVPIEAQQFNEKNCRASFRRRCWYRALLEHRGHGTRYNRRPTLAGTSR
jgi:hypothetical protein